MKAIEAIRRQLAIEAKRSPHEGFREMVESGLIDDEGRLANRCGGDDEDPATASVPPAKP